MKICELLIWTWETEIMKHDMIWRITMQIEGGVICQGWTTSSRGIIRILQRNSFLLVHALKKAVAISHQVIVLLFFLCFFLFCKMWGLLFHFLQLYQNGRANTTLSPELFHCIGFFWWYPALLTLFHWISQTSLKFDQWFAEYEELARKFAPIRVGEIFWINNKKGVIPFLVRKSDFIIFVINL